MSGNNLVVLGILAGSFMAVGVEALAAEQLDVTATRYSVRTNKAYESVVTDLKLAITDRNYRITSENEIGAALSLRHKSRFKPSTIVHFCNLETARKILDVAPDFLLHMPCKVAVYQVGRETVIETWLLPIDSRIANIAVEINNLLRRIVSEVAR